MSLVGLRTAKLERRRSFWVDLSRNILLTLFTNWIGLSRVNIACHYTPLSSNSEKWTICS